MDNLIARITIDPEIFHGKPMICGLRYRVQTMLELLNAGMSQDEIREDYPDLECEDLLAVLAFAARMTEVKHLYSLTL